MLSCSPTGLWGSKSLQTSKPKGFAVQPWANACPSLGLYSPMSTTGWSLSSFPWAQSPLQFLLLLDFLQPLSTRTPSPYSEEVSWLQLIQQLPSKERHYPAPTPDTTGTKLTLLM